MRLHILLPLLALTACDALPKLGPSPDSVVVAKAPASFKLNHENHVLSISIGSLVARNPIDGSVDRIIYTAPYSIFTNRPFLFAEDIVLTCNVYDGDKVLAGGAGFVVDRAPIGGIVEFKLARAVTEGRIDCFAANGKDFTSTTFFSQAARMGWETTPRSAVICGLAGKFRTGETA